MSLVTRYSVSSTGAEDGQRLAAFSIVRSFGITNWSRTAVQKRSSGEAGGGGRSAGRGHAGPGVRNGAAPPTASNRAKSRRFIAASGADSTPRLRGAGNYFGSRVQPAGLSGRRGGCGLPALAAPRHQHVADGDRVVHQGAEGGAGDSRSPERQAVAPQPARVAVDQLDVNPVDEQRRASESRKAMPGPGDDRPGNRTAGLRRGGFDRIQPAHGSRH